MKLTKTKLKQIIMEEIRSIIYEWPERDASREEEDEIVFIAEEEGHPDQSCDEAHPDQTHDEWEENK